MECGWIGGRGVLKDNQTDVLVHLAEASDANNKLAARAFFQFPYDSTIRIETVNEVVESCHLPSCRKKKAHGCQMWIEGVHKVVVKCHPPLGHKSCHSPLGY